MKRLVVGLLAMAVLLACAANALCAEDQSKVGFGMTEEGGQGKPASKSQVPEIKGTQASEGHGEAHTPRASAASAMLVPGGGAPTGGAMIKTAHIGAPPEQPPENLPENENIPENVPPEQPPEVPPGLEIRDGKWVITVKPTSHSARDTPITDLETIHSAEVVKRSENEG